jgi:hypothetical protein
MDKITDGEVTCQLREFVKELRKRYKPEKIILFGSRARGENLEESDVDLIIVSETFRGRNWIERIGEVAELWKGSVGIEPLCYTPEEFEKKRRQIGIVREAVKKGKEL